MAQYKIVTVGRTVYVPAAHCEHSEKVPAKT